MHSLVLQLSQSDSVFGPCGYNGEQNSLDPVPLNSVSERWRWRNKVSHDCVTHCGRCALKYPRKKMQEMQDGTELISCSGATSCHSQLRKLCPTLDEAGSFCHSVPGLGIIPSEWTHQTLTSINLLCSPPGDHPYLVIPLRYSSIWSWPVSVQWQVNCLWTNARHISSLWCTAFIWASHPPLKGKQIYGAWDSN